MTPIIAFLLAELLDIIITLIGLRVGLMEGNPFLKLFALEWMITEKILLATLVALCMYKFDFKKWNWIFPIVAFLPVIWNIFVMVIEL